MIGAAIGHHTSLSGAVDQRQHNAGFVVTQADDMRLDAFLPQVRCDQVAKGIGAYSADEPGSRTAPSDPGGDIRCRSAGRQFDAAGRVAAREQQTVWLNQHIPDQIANR
jgi:hypothetical protein